MIARQNSVILSNDCSVLGRFALEAFVIYSYFCLFAYLQGGNVKTMIHTWHSYMQRESPFLPSE